jgi:hypothetical protein
MVQVLERDSKLSELDQRADNLQEGASQFQTQVKSNRTGVRRSGLYWGDRCPSFGDMRDYIGEIKLRDGSG